MTADIVNNFPLRPMKTPFAGTALISANTSSVGGVNVSTLPATGENVANVATGFPETFSTSITNGGKYIKRADVNAMGYIATIMAFRQQMGMPNEWNSQICNAIGGYPKGAVLDYCVRNGSVITETYKITSLVDDNTENPTSIAQSNWTKWARVSINAEYLGSRLSQMKSWCIGRTSKVNTVNFGSNVTGTGTRSRYSASYKMPFDGFLKIFFQWDCHGHDQAALQILRPDWSLLMEQVICPTGERGGSYWSHYNIELPLEAGMIVRFRATQDDMYYDWGALIYTAMSFE